MSHPGDWPDPLPPVSRETFERLRCYRDLLEKWNNRINLIAPSTIDDVWNRHILDSAQIWPLARPSTASCLDLGSGGGLPGIVLAILAKELAPATRVSLVEADRRKSAFLRTAIREIDISSQAEAQTNRIAELPPKRADLVTARALAPLTDLLHHVNRHLANSGSAILPKGRAASKEIAEARRHWHFALTEHPSITDPEARLLQIKDLRRA